jgi:flavin reductase (DIM6/NTAB) family NADH-FMN oxidoreductase RutF
VEQALRDAMARLAAGVVVVCARYRTGYRGLTATSFTSVSLEPPLVLVCIDTLTATRDAIVETGSFSVSLLERRQEFFAERFAGRAPLVDPTWREVPHELSPGRLPIIGGSIAWLECSLHAVHEAGDHEVVLGRVTAAGVGQGEPLILWDRAFWTLS